MAYRPIDRYAPAPVGRIQDELVELLRSKPNVSSQTAKRLVFVTPPMSKIRWCKWLTADEMNYYLVNVKDIDKVTEADYIEAGNDEIQGI